MVLGELILMITNFFFFVAPLEKGSKLEELVRGIRVRKGLKPEIPPLDTYYDKL